MSNPVIWSYWNHEPIYHLKRMGNHAGTVFSLGEWVDEWYDRIHSEELIKKGAELGINTIYTHFYKGSGLVFEKREMLRTKELAEIAHKYGIKVLGYVSMGSVYTENITKEIPDIKDMLIVDRNGRHIPTLGNQYYRPYPCYNNDKYLAYLKSVLKYGIEEIGLDGFHFDNAATRHCHCENCQRKFKDFLRENFKNPYEVMGVDDFDYVEIPRLEYTLDPWTLHEITPKGNVSDPLYVWYFRFLRKTVDDFHKNCFDYVKEVSGGEAKVLHNPGFPRSPGPITDRDTRHLGYDPSGSPESCDFLFVENKGGYFGKNYGRTVGQTLAFKYGERFGYKVFDTSWAMGEITPESTNGYQFPKNKFVIEGFVMQAAVYGGIAGVPWTVRSMKNGDEVAIDTPYLFNGLKDCFAYFKDNYNIFDSKSYNYVKILHHPDNLTCAENGPNELNRVASSLTENDIRYSLITEDQVKDLKEGDIIVLPKIIYCKESLYNDLKILSEKGVKIIATEGFGEYNEYTKRRGLKNEILNLCGIEGSVVTTAEELPNYIDKKLSINVNDVLLETRITAEGKLVLHILNADAERDIPDALVTFEDDMLFKMKTAKILTPNDSTASVEIANGKATINIKNLKTLVSVVFDNQ